jgi:hypothetical protein
MLIKEKKSTVWVHVSHNFLIDSKYSKIRIKFWDKLFFKECVTNQLSYILRYT